MKQIKPTSRIDGKVNIPGSKSVTHRALIAAALAEGESRLKDCLICEDTLFTLKALEDLGVPISVEHPNILVSGTGGTFLPMQKRKKIYMGNSGTSYRLLLTTASLGQGEILLSGSPRMQERPIGSLLRALNQLGVEATCTEQKNFPPVLIRAKGLPGGSVEIEGNQSSQYVSSLLLSGPYAEKDVEIRVTGSLVSQPYVDITLDVMKTFGVSVDRDGYAYFKIPSGQRYQACRFQTDGDVSSASYFWAAAAITGGTIITKNIHPHTTRQGDIGVLDILERMGCYVEQIPDGVLVQGGDLSGIDVDMSAMPDMVPTLASIALFANGKTAIRNVAHLRLKESDRLRAIASEWSKLGSPIEEMDDGIIISGGGQLSGTTVEPHNDHRLAMSLAVIGLKVHGISLKNETCVNKSFPQFWDLWDQLSG
jgi:3-phosphoshikimate 1-carboxyvinyltransferase